mmetsp:Transcript_96671/g.277607  ORF Transcript_96671/g.277607 Transcript_96671/m.277607 type:complete len:343 (-) Transcript_96671:982-2010(-)
MSALHSDAEIRLPQEWLQKVRDPTSRGLASRPLVPLVLERDVSGHRLRRFASQAQGIARPADENHDFRGSGSDGHRQVVGTRWPKETLHANDAVIRKDLLVRVLLVPELGSTIGLKILNQQRNAVRHTSDVEACGAGTSALVELNCEGGRPTYKKLQGRGRPQNSKHFHSVFPDAVDLDQEVANFELRPELRGVHPDDVGDPLIQVVQLDDRKAALGRHQSVGPHPKVRTLGPHRAPRGRRGRQFRGALGRPREEIASRCLRGCRCLRNHRRWCLRLRGHGCRRLPSSLRVGSCLWKHRVRCTGRRPRRSCCHPWSRRRRLRRGATGLQVGGGLWEHWVQCT